MAQAIRNMHLVDEAAGASQAVEQVHIDNLPTGGGQQTTIPTGALVPGAGIDLARDADTGVITASVKAKGVTADMLADGVVTTVPAAPTADTLSGATDTGKSVLKAKDAATARTAIGAGTSSFSGSYNDLTDKPAIPGAYTLPAATTTTMGGVKKAAAVEAVASADAAVAAAAPTKRGSTPWWPWRTRPRGSSMTFSRRARPLVF